MRILCVMLMLSFSLPSFSQEVRKLSVSLSMLDVRGKGGGDTTFSEAMDATIVKDGRPVSGLLTIDSDYSTSGAGKVDRLLMSLRLVDPAYDVVDKRWRMMFLTQNEGDHSNSKGNLLLAMGLRNRYKYGVAEITAGMSRDKGGDWQTDFGFGVSYERQFGRLKVSRCVVAAPQATLAMTRA